MKIKSSVVKDLAFVAMILSAPHMVSSSTGVWIFLFGLLLLTVSQIVEG